jgi:hypothetical protein
MNTQTTCDRCGKTVGCSEWDIHTCTPPAQPTAEDSSAVQPAPVQEPVAYRQTGWAAHRDQYAVPVLFNPYTGQPRDVRDVQSDPQGILIVPPGKVEMLAAKPTHQQSLQVATPPAAPVQPLPFGVGGGLVAIKTLLSRDPCAHATVAIQMIDAILAEHSPQKANTP